MCTHNSTPQLSDHNDDGVTELPPARCDWSDQDKIELIRFLIEQKADRQLSNIQAIHLDC